MELESSIELDLKLDLIDVLWPFVSAQVPLKRRGEDVEFSMGLAASFFHCSCCSQGYTFDIVWAPLVCVDCMVFPVNKALREVNSEIEATGPVYSSRLNLFIC